MDMQNTVNFLNDYDNIRIIIAVVAAFSAVIVLGLVASKSSKKNKALIARVKLMDDRIAHIEDHLKRETEKRRNLAARKERARKYEQERAIALEKEKARLLEKERTDALEKEKVQALEEDKKNEEETLSFNQEVELKEEAIVTEKAKEEIQGAEEEINFRIKD